MYPDKIYTRKITISISKYSMLYTRPTLHCIIHSVNPLTDRDRLSIEELRAPLFISKAPYSAILSFTIFIGPAAIVWRILQNGVCPSFPPPFLELIIVFFKNFGRRLETQIMLCMTELGFFRKTSFALNTGAKIGFFWIY